MADARPLSRGELGMKVRSAREMVIVASLSLAASRIYSDEHPEDQYGDAQNELYEDMLWDAVRNFYMEKIQWDVTPV